MRVFLYGRPGCFCQPALEHLTQTPDGHLDMKFSGVKSVILAKEDIRWLDLVDDATRQKWSLWINNSDEREQHEYPLNNLFDELHSFCNEKSDVERFFFNMFVSISIEGAFSEPPAIGPALVPNVYVNWYSKPNERSKKEEPYIVDFLLKHKSIESGKTTIIEIDGPSHYAKYNERTKSYKVDEEGYALHCRKDLFLKRQGFNVIRIGRSDIRKIMNCSNKIEKKKRFYGFWNEVFENTAFIEAIELENVDITDLMP
ncbi:hypothetical protein [Geitlerinema sp. PCC 7407]|uniref:hypothetical protein n=1 Tax=Geitlerinema sp. PCC 7407 TaxID=1173025 RepID=UPI00029FAEB8|nr:hypothetical protein [Geitlerinema sp. PCC 7407]AFY66335.1 hypothetical protein GEI7407_1851 [Geitlerinema sp. PCC 7407]